MGAASAAVGRSANLGLLPAAIEEMLRWTSPVIYMRRTATADTELGGRQIEAGQKVVMYYGAANRDPRAFDEPERFDVTRTPGRLLVTTRATAADPRTQPFARPA